MKPLNVQDIQNLAEELKTFEGSRFQEVRLSGQWLALGLYARKLTWLVFDLSPVAPQIAVLESLAGLNFKDEKKPVTLFLRAHLLGQSLDQISAPKELGRVLYLHFVNGAEIEVRLFPRGQNVLVRSGGKELALFKPQALHELAEMREPSATPGPGLVERSQEWLALKQKGPQTVRAVSANATIKLQKAVQKIEAELLEKKNARWSEAGEWLKLHQSMSVPEDFTKYIDYKKTFSWNLENCFKKAKENEKKIVGTERRRQEILQQISQIESGEAPGPAKSTPKILAKATAKGRTFQLSDGLVLFIGKSAADNMRLLREAKPWHFWLHLRDQPSCHGLLHRNKGQNISDAALHQAAHHLIESHFGQHHARYAGEKFQLIVAECRFVKPIKGDRLGRVSYSDERTWTHQYRP